MLARVRYLIEVKDGEGGAKKKRRGKEYGEGRGGGRRLATAMVHILVGKGERKRYGQRKRQREGEWRKERLVERKMVE